ncbi:Lysylphosphatidylglycerol synthase TM region [uncultured archaeon]|nr:Lysylphosphatidylglycerol synthase TM region [uncultured archaeon]
MGLLKRGIKHGTTIILLAVGFFIIGAVLSYVGPEKVLHEFQKLTFEQFLLLFVSQVLLAFLWTVKWWIVLRHHHVPFKKVFPLSLIGGMMNNLTPIGLAGGELFRAYLLPKVHKDISTGQSTASVVVDMFIETLVALCLIPIALLISLSLWGTGEVTALLIACGFIVVATSATCGILIVSEKVSRRVIHYTIKVGTKIPISFLRKHALDAASRIDGVLVHFRGTMKKTAYDPVVMIGGFVTCLMVWVVSILRLFFIFRWLNYPLGLREVTAGRITVAATAYISIFPGAIGLWETAGTGVFSLAGVPASVSLAATLVERFYLFWLTILFGVAASIYMGLTHDVLRLWEKE